MNTQNNNKVGGKCLIHKTEHFLRRLRWRVHFHLQEKDNETSSDSDSDSPPLNHYGFPSPNSPPIIPELAGFEADLWQLVDSVSFTDTKSNFQKQLLYDAKNIRRSTDIVIPADKTRNYYEVKPTVYETMLRNNITANYKKCDSNMAEFINLEAKGLAEKLDIAFSDKIFYFLS